VSSSADKEADSCAESVQDHPPSIRRKLYSILEQSGDSRAGRVTHICILLLIVANVFAVILGSVKSIDTAYFAFFRNFEIISLLIFSVEYTVRLWVSVENGLYRRPIIGRIRYMFTPMALVDFVAILPFFLGLFSTIDTRMLRIVRVFKLTRHFAALEILLKVIRREARSLSAALFVLMILVVLASAGMYMAEREVQPEAFGNIPRAMWWATVTLTTVGYGDVVPVTTVGRFFSGMIVIIGIGIAALPAGIIAAGFTRELRHRREAFRLIAYEALVDGVIDEDGRHMLETARKELNMDREATGMVLHEVMGKKKGRQERVQCPHCGESLNL